MNSGLLIYSYKINLQTEYLSTNYTEENQEN